MRKKIFIAIALTFIGLTAKAQLQTSYFIDNYSYSYRNNPAIAPDHNFFGFLYNSPTVSLQSNIGVGSVIFNNNGTLVTGLNKNIPASEFLGGLKSNNSLAADIRENIFGFGFRTEHGYFNLECNLRGNVCLSLPYDIFSFVKEGSPRTYDFSNTNVNLSSYFEAALGYSRAVNEKLRVGGRLKFLAGIANGCLGIESADITVNSEQISTKIDASVRIAANMLRYSTMESERGNGRVIDLNSLQTVNDFNPAGYGIGLDLGATYEAIEGLTLSLGVIDLGAIKWNYNISGKSSASACIEGNDLENEYNDALDKLSNLTEFKEAESGSELAALPLTVNAGARYAMPFYNRLSAGVSYSYHKLPVSSWSDIRLGATVTPVPWFSLSGNAGRSTYGPVMGAAASFTLLCFNFFAGFDGYIGRTGNYDYDSLRFGTLSIPFPVDSFRYCCTFGLTNTFGRVKHNRK